MRDITHRELVKKTFKSGGSIIEEHYDIGCTTTEQLKVELLHAVVGIAGEAGELVDAVKKEFFYNHDLDVENVIEELGDLKYYIEAVVQNLQHRRIIGWKAIGWKATELVTHESIEDANIDKLRKRYDKLTFTNEAAKVRADKVHKTATELLTENNATMPDII